MDRKPLFPSANATVDDRWQPNDNKQDYDWLINQSYTTETAKKLVEFQKNLNTELKKLQPNGSDEEVSTEKNRKHIFISSSDSRGDQQTEASGPAGVAVSESQVSKTDKPYDHVSQREKHLKKKKKDKHYYDDSDNGKRKRKKEKRHYRSGSDSAEEHTHKKKKKRKHKKHKDKHKTAEKAEVEKYTSQLSNAVFLEEMQQNMPSVEMFRCDRIPDKYSYAYGSLYKQHVAHYKPLHGYCLGGNKKSWAWMDSKTKEKHKKPSANRYYCKENVARIRSNPVKIVYPADVNNSLDVGESYVELDKEKEAAADRDTDVRDRIMDDATSLYIQGKAPEVDEANTDDQIDTHRQKVAEFNKQLREDPHNIKLWLKFVSFQDAHAEFEDNPHTLSGPDDTKKLSHKGTLDKKLSILDKALEANPANIDLLLVKLDLESIILDASQINKKMENLLFIHPANTRLWKQYLLYNQSRLAVFTVSRVTKYYHRCIKTLCGILEGKVQTHSVTENLGQELVDIFFQYCHFLKQCGYRERLIATLQAMLEFNIFCPTEFVDHKRDQKIAAFEEFWESHGAKLGKSGAQGWACWHSGKGRGERIDTGAGNCEDKLEELEEAIIEEKRTKAETWLKIELLRDSSHWLPWEPDEGQTDDDCEDTERQVLFEDFSPMIFSVPHKLKFPLVKLLVNMLLYNYPEKESPTGSLTDTFIEYTDHITARDDERINETCLSPVCEILQDFTIELLKQLVQHYQGREQTELTLMYIRAYLQKLTKNGSDMSKTSTKEMRKVVKNVLKQEHSRNNLAVWAAYVDMEQMFGKPGEALTIIETALSMYSGTQISDVCGNGADLITMFCKYAELVLNISRKCCLKTQVNNLAQDQKSKVMSVLSCLVDGRKVSKKNTSETGGSVVLRTLSKFSRLIDTSIHTDISDLNILCDWFCKLCWCHALFQYCATGLQASLTTLTKHVSAINGKWEQSHVSCVEQTLYLFQLQLILHHMSVASIPLTMLREQLDAALARYPKNPAFLALFVDVECKSRISGRLNRQLDRWCRSADSGVPVVYAVLTQLQFLKQLASKMETGDVGLNTSGVVHRTRNWLEHCLAKQGLRHCPLLWRLYLQLEHQTGNTGRLKGVFYRAIQECPWVKSLYLDAVEFFGSDQLQEIVDLMTEKELRVQLPVEELDILMS